MRPSGGDGAKRHLLIGTAGTLVLNVSTLVTNFIIVIVLSRHLGADGYGAYAFALAWVAVLAVPSTLGLTPLVIRLVSSFHARSEWGLLRGLLRGANAAVAVAAIAVTGLAAAIGWALERAEPDLLNPYLIGLVLVPVLAFTSLRQAAMQGFGRVVLGRAPETFITPVLFLALIGLSYLVLGRRLSASSAVALNVTAGLVAFVCGAYLLRRTLPREVRTAKREYEWQSWARSAIPLLALSGVSALQPQIGTIVLGSVAGAEEAGVYNVAQRVALLATFLHMAAAYPLMPMVARLFASKELERIEAVLTHAARVFLLLSAPIALVLLVFAGDVLEIFGSGFDDGVTALRILVVGMIIRLAAGFAGLALVMTGHEASLTKTVAAGTALTVALSLALGPIWGAEGAAVALVVGLGVSDVVVVYVLWRRLGIYVAPIPRLSRGSR